MERERLEKKLLESFGVLMEKSLGGEEGDWERSEKDE